MSRRGWIVVFGPLALVILVLALVLPDPGSEEERYTWPTTHSAGPRGAKALMLWVESMGYGVNVIENRPFSISDDTDLLFVLAPTSTLAESHVEGLSEWVEQGGVLVAVPGEYSVEPDFGDLTPEFDEGSADSTQVAWPVQPLLDNPPVDRVTVEGQMGWEVEADRGDVSYLEAGDRVALVSRHIGKGKVYALTDAYPLTNEGLEEPDHAGLVLNLLASVPEGSVVGFDEYHHGYTEREGLGYLILSRPWGWAFLLACLSAFAFAVLSGRRFGAPVPAGERPRRSSTEYVTSMGTLLRTSGDREPVARYFAERLKRTVAERFGLGRDASDVALAEAARGATSAEGAGDDVAAVLAGLGRGKGLSDSRLVDLVRRSHEIEAAVHATKKGTRSDYR